MKQIPTIKRCDECGSEYFAHTSQMMSLCPECAHHLYGYPNCLHQFEDKRCKLCGWDGSSQAVNINDLK